MSNANGTKHTAFYAGHPAPFRTLHGPSVSSDVCCIRDAQGAEVATVVDCKLAKFLASAPDLLELLYDALPCVEESEQFNKPSCRKLSGRIRAALAKAEGRAEA